LSLKLGVWNLGFSVLGLEFGVWVWSLWFLIWGLKLWVYAKTIKTQTLNHKFQKLNNKPQP
jgi:hypothetical protein